MLVSGNESSRVLLVSNRNDIFHFCRNALEGLYSVDFFSFRKQQPALLLSFSATVGTHFIVDSSLFFSEKDAARFIAAISGVELNALFLCPYEVKKNVVEFLRHTKASLVHIPCEKDFFRGIMKRKFYFADDGAAFHGENESFLKLHKFIGHSSAIQKVKSEVAAAAGSDCSVLFEGETGTGKSFLARILHEVSNRAAKQFVQVNSADLKETLAVSNLYGTINGAFTGAVSRPGHFSVANGGAIFFDEIGTMHISVQESLLTVLDSGVFYKVGSVVEQKVDVRFLSATNADLKEMLFRGDFRRDLYNRISDCVIRIPALRERPEDVLEILEHYLHAYNCRDITFSTGAVDFLLNFYWPGNTRDVIRCSKYLVSQYAGKKVCAEDIASWTEKHCFV